MRVLIVPDSFKGTLTSEQVCDCIEKGILQTSDADITSFPFSDGGEGFGKCLSNLCNGEILYTNCTDLYGRIIKGHIYTYKNTAIIESAVASGLQKKKDVMAATSYGTGELIKFAVSKGFNNIILGLGGSGCCDGGAGALAALGVEFRNIDGEIIEYPAGKDIENIYGVKLSNRVKDINFTYACDVDNEYYGKNGAAYIFAKQKGATDEDIVHLDNGLKMLDAFFPVSIGKLKGAGACGGLCGGLYSIYGGTIKSGFDILADACNLEQNIKDADIVITGEGKCDKQTLMGKLPYRIAMLAEKYGKECIVISGSADHVKLGSKMITLASNGISLEEAMENPAKILINKSKNILK